MATIVDVAEYAGVSVATVSRMMNSPDVVSEKTKKKIHKAMQELHYQPNAMARALQQKKSNIIGLVLPYINYAFFSELTDAVEESCHEHGYKLMLCKSGEHQEREQEMFSILQANKVDGILVCSRFGEGDKFGYDYNIYVNKQSAWVRYQGNNGGSLNYFASGKIGSTQMFRDGLMRNGRAPLKSLGSSGTAKFLEGGIKAGLNWAINGNHSFTLNAGYEERAPLAYNSFIAPRIKNDFVRDLKTERIIGGDLTYNFNTPWVMGRLTGYYTRFQNQVEMDAFYNDSEARFTYLSMNGIEKEHWGIEAAATFKLTSELSLTAIGTWSEAKYTNNPDAVLTYESENESNLDRVYAKGMRANGTPLSAYSLALDYNVKGWFFNLTGNYYDRVYIDFSSYRRLGSVLDKNGAGVDANGNPVLHVPGQEKLDGGFMLDASIGKYIRLRNGKSISLNLSLTNILNNTDLRTGGFEQNRDDNYKDGDARVYKFSKNSKYFYAFPFNAFLNIGYRF